MDTIFVISQKDVSHLPNTSRNQTSDRTEQRPGLTTNSKIKKLNVCQICKQEFKSIQDLKKHVFNPCGKRSNGENRESKIHNQTLQGIHKSRSHVLGVCGTDYQISSLNASLGNGTKHQHTRLCNQRIGCDNLVGYSGSKICNDDLNSSDNIVCGNNEGGCDMTDFDDSVNCEEAKCVDTMNFEKSNKSDTTSHCHFGNMNDSISRVDNKNSDKILSSDMTNSNISHEEIRYTIKRCMICQVCLLDGKEFSCKQKSSLDDHMQNHHSVKLLTYKIQTDYVKVNAVTSKESIVSRKEELRVHCKVCTEALIDEADFDQHACKGFANYDIIIQQYRQNNFIPYCRGVCMCPVCKMYFSKYSFLNQHIQSYHLPLSERKLVSIESNKDSQTVTRNTKMTLVCLICDRFSSTSKAATIQHFRNHYGVKMYRYKVCYKATEKDTQDSIERVLLEFEQFQFYCKHCKRDFLSEEEFIAHEIRHEVVIKCPICENESTEADYIEHVEKMHNSVRYCKTCSKKFINYPRFIEHLLSKHTSGQMYTCLKCQTHFPHFRKYRYHMNSKHNLNASPLAQVCYVCGTKYSDYKALSAHIRTHDCDLPKCDHCQKTFTQMGSLRSHIVVHFGGPAYHNCKLCQKSFRTAKYLKMHNKKVHMKDHPFLCDKCGHRAPSVTHLTNHMKVHHKAKQFQCKTCEVRFRWPDNLKVHLRKGVCTNI